MLTRHFFDLVVACTLRATDGLLLTRALRCQSTIPLVLLISGAVREDRIAGLDAGADECLSQTVSISELLARIRTILRRSSSGGAGDFDTSTIWFEGWRINRRHRLVYDPAGETISLTAAEFDILLAFCLNSGRVMTRADLLDLAHVGVGNPGERSIDVHIRRLRCKIEENPGQPALIKTIRLGGYVFTATVGRHHRK